MEWVAFILSILALVISLLALKRAGGVGEVKKEIESLSSMGESLRKKTADILDRLEKRVRGEEKLKEEKEGEIKMNL
ncbi:MAG: hypothetical protein ACUVWV_15580 [Thermodesulfobacteriota bacterium]